MSAPRSRLPASLELPAYFTLAFAISWSFWLAAAFSGASIATPWVRWLVYAGIAGPALAGVGLLYLGSSPAQRGDYWDRVFEFRRVGPRWLAVTVLSYPLLTALALALDWIASGRMPDASVLVRLLAHPALLLSYLGFILLLGPVPEELGWRGYALDRLQLRRTPLRSSLILGAAWAAWHLPLFFVSGTYQNELGFGTIEFWLFILTAVSCSVLMTWIYNGTDRSILSAMLFHGVVNFSRAAVTLSVAAEVTRAVLLVALAAGVASSWRRSRVGRSVNAR
jgi:membrane protease YdiL (CAAX protease family)